jgi:Transglutaminase-like superfamily
MQSERLTTFNAPLYDIAPGVYISVTGDGSVLLDLKRDKYLGLGRQDTEWVAALVDAWPKPIWDFVRCESVCTDDARCDAVRAQDLCRSLANAGLLVRTDTESTPRRQPLADMRLEWISIGDELEATPRLGIAHIVNFFKAYVEARFAQVWTPFFATVETARIRKLRDGRAFEVGDILQVTALVAIFRRLRPFVFAADGRCLLHAMTLINFLARYDFYPEWVIGVATQPWGAHSWVQWGNYLLDSNPEKICRFTPILVV